MKKLGIIFKSEDEIITGTAEQIQKELSAKFKIISSAAKMKTADYILTLGGDGTILRAARFSCQYKIPMLCVHLGGLGILTEISLEELSGAITNVLKGKYLLDSRTMLKVDVVRNGKTVMSSFALNDVVVCKKEIARTIKLKACLKDELLAEYVSDGLIASTPTGSTAYNFAVMGPVIPLDAKSYALSPICPHRAADRSIVLEKPCTIEINKGDEVLLTADGQETFVVKRGDKINVGLAKEKALFVRFKKYSLWNLLREKLGWN